MTEATPLRWGILGPGGIARTFARNLLQFPPSSRGVDDIVHVITAVASSSALVTAQKFIEANVTPHQQSHSCAAHGSYQSLVESSDIDIVYIATPHSSHFRNATLAITNRKPVLCEKPLCVNAKQAQILFDLARQHNVFFMEAVWTRFFPISLYVQDIVRRGQIGEVMRVSADFSMGCGDKEGVEAMFGEGAENRMVNPRLAGGVLLDLGVYSLTWIFLSVYHLLPSQFQHPPNLAGVTMTPYAVSDSDNNTSKPPEKWVDASTTILLTLPSAPSGASICHAVATTSLYSNTDPGYGGDDPSNTTAHRYSVPSARIQGTKGEIQVFGPLPRPQMVRVFTSQDRGTIDNDEDKKNYVSPGNVVNSPSRDRTRVEERIFESMGDGTGMYWEADEAARCIRAGKIQSEIMPWKESLDLLEIMDEARQRCRLHYGEEVEGTE